MYLFQHQFSRRSHPPCKKFGPERGINEYEDYVLYEAVRDLLFMVSGVGEVGAHCKWGYTLLLLVGLFSRLSSADGILLYDMYNNGIGHGDL